MRRFALKWTTGAVLIALSAAPALSQPNEDRGDSPLRWDNIALGLRLVEAGERAMKHFRLKAQTAETAEERTRALQRLAAYERLLTPRRIAGTPQEQARERSLLIDDRYFYLESNLRHDHLWDPHTDPYR